MSKKSKAKHRRSKGAAPQAPVLPAVLNPSAMSEGINTTKKGIMADQLRAAQAAQNGMSWTEVDNLYMAMANGLVTFAEAVAANQKMVQAAGRADAAFHRLVLTSVTDTKDLSEELVALKQRQMGKTGPILLDDMPLYYELATSYKALTEKISQLSFQIGQELTAYNSEVITRADPSQNLEVLVNKALAGNAGSTPTSA